MEQTDYVHECSCGHAITAAEWEEGEMGIQLDEHGRPVLMLSNCQHCGSTRSRDVSAHMLAEGLAASVIARAQDSAADVPGLLTRVVAELMCAASALHASRSDQAEITELAAPRDTIHAPPRWEQ